MTEPVIWSDPSGDAEAPIEYHRMIRPRQITHADGRVFIRTHKREDGRWVYCCDEPPRPETPITVELWNEYGASIGQHRLWHAVPVFDLDGVRYDRWEGDDSQLIYVARGREQRVS